MTWARCDSSFRFLGAALAPAAFLMGLLGAVLAPGGGETVAAEPFAVDSLEIVTRRGRFPVTVEIATSWAQRAQGLQNRKSVPAGTGMLFDYGRPQMVTMWMKDTYVPLDMLFIAADGKIVHLVRGAEPLSLAHISSEWPVRAVLELPAGAVADHGILPGDSVIFRLFGIAAGAGGGR